MKLKNKLARGAARIYLDSHGEKSISIQDFAEYLFSKGFETAREMAVGTNKSCVARCGTCLDLMEKLGEEEVE